jgi:hypothetical protein
MCKSTLGQGAGRQGGTKTDGMWREGTLSARMNLTSIIVDGLAVFLWIEGILYARKRAIPLKVKVFYSTVMLSVVLADFFVRKRELSQGRFTTMLIVVVGLAVVAGSAFVFFKKARLIVPPLMFIAGIATVFSAFFSHSFVGVLGFLPLFLAGILLLISSLVLGVFASRKRNTARHTQA